MSKVSLTSGREFRRVYRAGTKVREDGVTVWVAPSAEATETRLGLAIRAAVGTAVVRNRLRRRVKEIFRAYQPAPGNDVIVQANREAAGRNFQELSTVVTTALGRAGVRSAR